MRDKVMFFILGAVLATIAYFVGDLETTAEDEFHEIDVLRVNSLHVKEGIAVGERGKKYIMIATDNKFAEISLYGAEIPEPHEKLDLGDTPVVSLIAGETSAVIRARSHKERPDARAVMGTIRRGGKHESMLIIEDLDGKNGISAD